ncbi:LPXTG cell wall anchor domain-containing protein [Nocardioides ultimimeridianus]
MIRKIAALMVVAFATLMVPFASPSHAAPVYGNKIPTQVHITVVTAKKGAPLKVRFRVTAADGTTPAGQLAYTITRASTTARTAKVASRATSGTVAINGSVAVDGQVAQVGTYVVSGSFTPTNSAKYLPSSNATRAGVKAVGGQHHNNGGGGSGLPNTGGPDLGWLIAGLVLAGAGAGTVAYARRRQPAAA